MANMLNSPEFMQQMSSVMSNPQVIDQIIQSNPQLQAMGPRVREIFQSEGFRQMLYALPNTSVCRTLIMDYQFESRSNA